MTTPLAPSALPAAPAPAPMPTAGLRNYYALRAAVSALWVASAFLVGQKSPPVAALLLVAYPAWDALANGIDAARNGGLARNRTQALNLVVSAITALAVLTVVADMHAVLRVFGVWAILSGLLQLATGVRRWKSYGAQWAMILSGAQSALAGSFFIKQSFAGAMPSITNVAGYASVGAVYFLISAGVLTFRGRRV